MKSTQLRPLFKRIEVFRGEGGTSFNSSGELCGKTFLYQFPLTYHTLLPLNTIHTWLYNAHSLDQLISRAFAITQMSQTDFKSLQKSHLFANFVLHHSNSNIVVKSDRRMRTKTKSDPIGCFLISGLFDFRLQVLLRTGIAA